MVPLPSLSTFYVKYYCYSVDLFITMYAKIHWKKKKRTEKRIRTMHTDKPRGSSAYDKYFVQQMSSLR